MSNRSDKVEVGTRAEDTQAHPDIGPGPYFREHVWKMSAATYWRRVKTGEIVRVGKDVDIRATLTKARQRASQAA